MFKGQPYDEWRRDQEAAGSTATEHRENGGTMTTRTPQHAADVEAARRNGARNERERILAILDLDP
jgi:hypothetical protein